MKVCKKINLESPSLKKEFITTYVIVSYNDCDKFAIYKNIELFYYIPETNTMIYVIYTSLTKKKNRKQRTQKEKNKLILLRPIEI